MPKQLDFLDSCLDRAIRFISIHRKEFAIGPCSVQDLQLSQLKPFAELVLTLNILKKHGYHHREMAGWESWLWREEARHGELLLDVLLVRTDLIVLACLYADFVELGFENEQVHAFLSHLSKINPVDHLEQPYWRKLDIEYSLSRLGIRKFPSAPLSRAWISGLLPAWTMHTDLAYAVTHEMFYVTDFGGQKERLEPEIRKYLETWIGVWIRMFIEEKNWDLTAELLMVRECVGCTEAADDALHCLCEHQHEEGLFPSPLRAGEPLFQAKDTPTRRKFLANYHTTLVAIMAIAMRLAREKYREGHAT